MAGAACTLAVRGNTLAKRITVTGLLIALAMMLSYIEILIPFHVGVPGIKLGLANIVVLTAFFFFPPAQVLAISLFRVLLTGLLTGSGMALVFSLAGGLCSFFVMLLCCKSNWFSPVGISLAGGVTHNIAQLCIAVLLLQTTSLVFYLPFLLLAGIVTGLCNGLLVAKMLPTLTSYLKKNKNT